MLSQNKFCIFIFSSLCLVLKLRGLIWSEDVSQKVLLWCSLHIAQTHVAIGVNFTITQQPSVRRVIESETGDVHAA